MDNKQDLQILTKYPEYYALKEEFIKFVDEVRNLDTIDPDKLSRVSVEVEVVARKYAAKKIKDLLVKLGLINRADISKRVQTYE